jgi:hypothetical protein
LYKYGPVASPANDGSDTEVSMEELRTYICVSPAEATEASRSGFPLCHMAYRIGQGFRLYRSGIGINVRNGMMLLTDYGLDKSAGYSPALMYDIKRECDIRNYDGVVCDFENGENEVLGRFITEAGNYFPNFGIKLYVPISYADEAPNAHVLVPSAVAGGSYMDHLNRSLFKYGAERAAIYYEPISIDFVMPSPAGDSDRISRSDLEALIKRLNAVSYYSRDLGAYYFTYRDDQNRSRFVLFDDDRSMLKKLGMARQAGFTEAFILYADASGNLDQLKTITRE